MKYNLILLIPLLLTSCFGINMDITLNRNGSGTISIDYQTNKSLDALGRLDGNERWNTIPVGRADFERTLERLPDMKLISHSSREDERNLNVSVRMEFSSIEGLLSFLDAHGQKSSFTGNVSSGRLLFTLNDGTENINPALESLLSDISRGYFANMGMTFPSAGNLNITDKDGNSVHNDNILRRGRSVSANFPLFDVLSAKNGLYLDFSW